MTKSIQRPARCAARAQPLWRCAHGFGRLARGGVLAWLLVALMSMAQEVTVLPAAGLAGQKARLGNQTAALLVIPDGGLDIPLELPPGRVRISAYLRHNTLEPVFATPTIAMWRGPYVVRTSAQALTAGAPLSLTLVAYRPGPARLRLVWELPPAAALKQRELRQAAEAAEARPGDLSWMDDKGDVAKQFQAEVSRDILLDADAARAPLLLLERLTVESLPPPTSLPEIANVVPAMRTPAPFIITGENFEQPGLEAWSWQPPNDAAQADAGLAELAAGHPPALPLQPPDGAQRSELLDVDTQTLTVPLPGDLLWLRNRHGWSQPCLNNVPRVHWLGSPAVAAGATLTVYGYALRSRDEMPGRAVLLAAGTAPLPLESLPEGDRYFAELRVPRATPPLAYSLWLHNGSGGRWGWSLAGTVTVTAPAPPERLFQAVDYGADGNDLLSDRDALRRAFKAAADAGGGVVLLSPGCFRTEETLELPENVILRGATREQTALEGFGYDRARRAPSADYGDMCFQAPTLVILKSGSGLQQLNVRGIPATGAQRFPSYPLVATAGTRHVRIENCLLYGPPEEEASDVSQHATALCAQGVQYLNVADSEIVGQVELDSCYRLDFLRNRIREGISELLSVELRSCHNSRVDGNTILDGAGRLCPIQGGAHGLYRHNRILYKFRADIASGEGFLAHGDIPAAATPGAPPDLVGAVAGATRDTLTLAGPPLRPGLHRGCTVHITAGRGFGQYRVVADNTADTLTLERPWAVVPDTTSHYVFRSLFTENAWVGNQSVGHAVSAWYNDELGSIWDGHRDADNTAYMMGGDVLGRTTAGVPVETGHLGVSAGNLFYRCTFSASRLNLEGIQQFEPARPQAPLFATFVVGCTFSRPLLSRDNSWSGASAEASGMVACMSLSFLNNYGLPTSGPSDRGKVWPGMSHTIIHGNRFSQAPLGLRIGPLVRKTFILDNEFRDITYQPWQDGGAESIYRGNRRAADAAADTAPSVPFGDGSNTRVIPVPRDTPLEADGKP